MLVYVSIGNTDGKLSQGEWAAFHRDVTATIREVADTVHGQWASESTSQWQNACWCFEFVDGRTALKDSLTLLARKYRQDAIAWADAPVTEFL